jgi:Fe2+ or Zn2+ uptake regulation protein
MIKKNEILSLIKSKGDRLTKQKKNILNVLFDNQDRVLSVGDIIKKLPDKESMDDATVYRNIQRLMELEVLESFVDDTGINRYVISCHKGHHHHMICISCGKIFEIPCQNSYWDKCALDNGFKEIYHKLEVYGMCNDCKMLT